MEVWFDQRHYSDNVVGSSDLQAGHAGSIPVTRSSATYPDVLVHLA